SKGAVLRQCRCRIVIATRCRGRSHLGSSLIIYAEYGARAFYSRPPNQPLPDLKGCPRSTPARQPFLLLVDRSPNSRTLTAQLVTILVTNRSPNVRWQLRPMRLASGCATSGPVLAVVFGSQVHSVNAQERTGMALLPDFGGCFDLLRIERLRIDPQNVITF